MQNTVLPEIPSRMTHGSNILSEALLFKRNNINKWLCDAPFGSSCALTWNTCVASSSLSSFFRVESWPVIWSMAMGQSWSKMEYLIRERSKRSSLNMKGKGIFSETMRGGTFWSALLILSTSCNKLSSHRCRLAGNPQPHFSTTENSGSSIFI